MISENGRNLPISNTRYTSESCFALKHSLKLLTSFLSARTLYGALPFSFALLTDSFLQLYMAAVGLVFAPLAPLVVVAAAVVFWISSFVYKYQLMFVFVSKVESGGVSGSSILVH